MLTVTDHAGYEFAPHVKHVRTSHHTHLHCCTAHELSAPNLKLTRCRSLWTDYNRHRVHIQTTHAFETCSYGFNESVLPLVSMTTMSRNLKNASSSSWQYQSNDRWTSSQQHQASWQWNEGSTLSEQHSAESETEYDAIKWDGTGWTSAERYNSDWQWKVEEDSVEHETTAYTDRDTYWTCNSAGWADSNQHSSNDTIRHSTDTLRETMWRQQNQIFEIMERIDECVTEIKCLRRTLHDVLQAYQSGAEEHINDDSLAGSSADQVERGRRRSG